MLSRTPIIAEAEQFPGLARETAYLYCTLLAENGGTIPSNVLALIPDDFKTINDKNRVVTKADLISPTEAHSKTPS
jgi:hypothetical protein